MVPRWLRRCLRVTLTATLLACAALGAHASGVVETAHVRVVFGSPELEPFARRVAAIAESALHDVAARFGVEPFDVTFTLDDTTDVFNALAAPIPRPTVALRTTPPLEETLGLGAESWLELLVVHELTHLAHFTQTEAPEYGLGFVGDGVALPPPAWVTEGLATWVESDATTGGRLQDARTAGLLGTLALGDAWPSLADASLSTYAPWPGGETRYLLGAAFVDRLVRVHGWRAVIDAVEAYNAAPLWSTFAAEWSRVTGTDAEAEWTAMHEEIAASARERQGSLPEAPRTFTGSGWYTGLPVASPSGSRLAWRTWPAGVAVAAIERAPDGGRALGPPEVVRSDAHVESLDWLDEKTLVYTRIHRTPSTSYAEIFELDLATGREARRTEGARAHFVRAEPGTGCVRWVRAGTPHTAAVMRICRSGPSEVVWEAHPEQEIVGLALARDGRMAVSVWQAGMVGLAVLEARPAAAPGPAQPAPAATGASEPGFVPRYLTYDRFLDLDPVWTSAGTLRFRSDRTGRFELWEVAPDEVARDDFRVRLTRWTSTAGGVFGASRDSVIVVLGETGFDLAWLPMAPLESVDVPLEERGQPEAPALAPSATPYAPWSSLAPFGWLPGRFVLGLDPFRLGAEIVVHGQDASERHGYALTLGADTALSGPLGSAYASFRYDWQPAGMFTTSERAPPFSVSAEVGVWPHTPHLATATETAAGARFTGTLRLRADAWAAAATLRAGALHLGSRGAVLPDIRVDALWTTARSDRWGYPSSGARLGAAGRWTPTSGDRGGVSAGAWVDARFRQEALGGSLGAGVRAGYRIPPPVPVQLDGFAAALSLDGRWSVPTAWRYGDGRYALERLTISPAAHVWTEGDGPPGFGVGVTVGADLVVQYALPVVLAVEAGWSQRPWVRFGASISD